jgi:outer membrane protein OmpA-like peptidoglycan-associated protein
MKCRVLMAMISIAVTGIFVPVLAQKNYYVVVGAFSTDANAKEFSTQLPKMNADTAYAMANEAGVAQMYVLHTTDEEVAVAKSLELQKALNANKSSEGSQNYESITIRNSPDIKGASFETGGSSLYADASSSRTSGLSAGNSAPAVVPASKMFKFTISDHRNQNIEGKIHFVDFDREKDLAVYATSANTTIINPGKNPDMALVCGIFGYKLNEKYIDYANPSSMEGAFQDENGAWVIPYKLERLEKGDVSVMYNVAFYRDAVVMLPPSQADLDELVAMMKENPQYEITVHGHCNGRNDRKIIARDYGNSFFDIGNSKPVYGSAKKLSSLRANAVKEYLIRNEIAEDRIKTYAWGGSYMLADPSGPSAKLNDRIEIEIRKD